MLLIVFFKCLIHLCVNLDLSLIELTLVIAMMKLEERQLGGYNFKMILEEYAAFSKGAGALSGVVFTKQALLKVC
jgi:ABC-type transport system involved in cytochrome c biogenesis permease component